MVHRVFKVKYFVKNSFLEAQLGRRPSYAWKIIMAAKEIVKKGSRWNIGNRERVRIWKDQWLPTPKSFKVMSPRAFHSRTEMVSSLIDMEKRN